MQYTDFLSNRSIFPALVPLLTLTIDTNIQMYWPIEAVIQPYIVATITAISASVDGLTVNLPNATLTGVGQTFTIYNPGMHDFTLKFFGAGGASNPIVQGSVYTFSLYDNTTGTADERAAGKWYKFNGLGTPGIGVIGINVAGTGGNLTVSPDELTSNGAFNFGLGADLEGLTSFGNDTGFAVRTLRNTWDLRTFAGTTNQILIENPDGVSGDPVFSLASDIRGIDVIRIGNLIITDDEESGNPALIPVSSQASMELVAGIQGAVYIGEQNQTASPPFGGARPRLVFPFMSDTFTTATGYFSICAPDTIGSSNLVTQCILPLVLPTEGQVLQATAVETVASVSVAQLGWASTPTIGATTTANTLAMFTDAAGTLVSTGITINGAAGKQLSTIESLTTGFLTIDQTGTLSVADAVNDQIGVLAKALAIESIAGDTSFPVFIIGGKTDFPLLANISVDQAQILQLNALAVGLLLGTNLIFYTSDNSKNITFEVPNALSETVTYYWPIDKPTGENQPLVYTLTGSTPGDNEFQLKWGTAIP